MAPTRIAVLAGGVGAARFLRGVIALDNPVDCTAIVNTGDDLWLHGLRICPDLDTITYTLAGAIDPERGWGLTDEGWITLGALERYQPVTPEGSRAATTWFSLGDRDLATHLYRTARLAEGASLTEVTSEISQAWHLPIRLQPMSDDPVETMISVPGRGLLGFQEYFVKERHAVPVDRIEFRHQATAHPDVIAALEHADAIIIAPSNPLVSIGPIRSLPGIDEMLISRRATTVAISPIVGGDALKGPAARMLDELGHERSVVGIARLYHEIAGTLIIDEVDRHLAPAVRDEGMACVVAPTVMHTPEMAADLAALSLAVARTSPHDL